MSSHHGAIAWSRASHVDEPQTYSRNHSAIFNGGQALSVSASTDYKGDAACADPEQLLLTALASCHMLTFLAVAEVKGFQVQTYRDQATAFLEKNEQGRMAVTRIELAPKVVFSTDRVPDAVELEKLHANAHRNCFIANSISAKVTVLSGLAIPA